MKSFMELTIKSHSLRLVTFDEARHLLPARMESSYFEAKRLAKDTSYYERMNILVSDENNVYPPMESFTKSFEKWLELQTHDVKAVNSLYNWAQDARNQEMLLWDDVSDLETLAENDALKAYVEPILKRKNEQIDDLITLQRFIEAKKDKVRTLVQETEQRVTA